MSPFDINTLIADLKAEIAASKRERANSRFNMLHDATQFSVNIMFHERNGKTRIIRTELEGFDNMFLIANYWYKHNEGVKKISVYINEKPFYHQPFNIDNQYKCIQTRHNWINIK